MKTILVPIDGSDCSNRAIDQAVELARLYQAQLILLHVEELQTFFGYTEFSTLAITMEVEEMLRKRQHTISESLLKQAKERCTSLGETVRVVTREGHPVDAIVAFAGQEPIDLIVMGSHGRSGFRHSHLGSTTHKVLSAISTPVLIIR